jgi:hypothetical protein
MAFRKAESLQAKAGYFNYLGRVQDHEKMLKQPPKMPKPTKFESAINSMDHDWLMEQARQMNQYQGAVNEEDNRAHTEYERRMPSDGMKDIHNAMTETKLRSLISKEHHKIEKRTQKIILKKKNAMQNVRPCQHVGAWRPTKDTLRQPLSEARQDLNRGATVGEYNVTKETYYTNRHFLGAGAETNSGITAYKQ